MPPAPRTSVLLKCGRCQRDGFANHKGLQTHETACRKSSLGLTCASLAFIGATTQAASNIANRIVKKKRFVPSRRESASASMTIDEPQYIDNTFDQSDTPMTDEANIPPTPPVPPQMSASGRPQRRIRPLAKFKDFLAHGDGRIIAPAPPTPQPSEMESDSAPTAPLTPPPGRLHRAFTRWRTGKSAAGLYREYLYEPSYIPDLGSSPPAPAPHASPSSPSTSTEPIPSQFAPVPPASTVDSDPEAPIREKLGPLPNFTSYLHAYCHFCKPTSTASDAQAQEQINIVKEKRFGGWKHADASEISYAKLRSLLSSWRPPIFGLHKGWKMAPVVIDVPLGDKGSEQFEIPGLYYRSIVEVLERVVKADPNRKSFHLHPFREYFQRGESDPERVFWEAFSCDAVIEAYEELNKLPPEPTPSGGVCELERVIFFIRVWSDATLLTNFGSTSLWPIYICWANQSKYQHYRKGCHAIHDIAHIPKLPPELAEFIFAKTGKKPLLAHCKRELFHAVWLMLMDAKFVEVYEHGIVLEFWDGIRRRVYIQFLTYSADYPEKVLIATIRNLGKCPCPRCLITKEEIKNLGTARDQAIRTKRARVDDLSRQNIVKTAHDHVYSKGYAVTATGIERMLAEHSRVPTLNAFSTRLAPFNFDFHKMLVPDLMHEFETGEWKTLLRHLIRMLESLKGGKVQELNSRYRQIQPFGRETIRRIWYDVSDLSQLAARDYEDILQCSVPVFEGLFPDPVDNKKICHLLATLAEWHALAKYRLHTESTLNDLDNMTKALGKILRDFATNVSPKYETKESPKEAAARRARQSKNGTVPSGSGAVRVQYNIDRIKLHSLGDYMTTIRYYGTTDSYTTALGETRHIVKKNQYALTNRRQHVGQIVKLDTIEENLLFIKRQVDAVASGLSSVVASLKPTPGREKLTDEHLNRRYIISKKGLPLSLKQFLRLNGEEPALKSFRYLVLDYILCHLRNVDSKPDGELFYKPGEYRYVDLSGDRLHVHSSLRINYTTYDLQRESDHIRPSLKITTAAIKPHSARSIIMLSTHDSDPTSTGTRFQHAQVLGIFHATARDKQSNTSPYQDIPFLWVRWLVDEPRLRYGLQVVTPVGDLHDQSAFGIVDPADVVRATHLLPAFVRGPVEVALPSAVNTLGDWASFYVDRWVDRDMVVRFRGGSVGHVDPTQYMSTDVEGIIEADAEEAEEGETDTPMGVDGDTDLQIGDDTEETLGADGYDSEEEPEEDHTPADAMGEADAQDHLDHGRVVEGQITDDEGEGDLNASDDDDGVSLEDSS